MRMPGISFGPAGTLVSRPDQRNVIHKGGTIPAHATTSVAQDAAPASVFRAFGLWLTPSPVPRACALAASLRRRRGLD
jgi:hypothetical protein